MTGLEAMASTAVFPTYSYQDAAARYESLIRIAASVRSRKDPQSLFDLLAHELGQVIRFDAIAQFDESSNKVNWHMCPNCHPPEHIVDYMDKEETLAAWVYRNQETVWISSVDQIGRAHV